MFRISSLGQWMAAGLLLLWGEKAPLQAATFADPKFTEQSIAAGLDPTAMDIAPDGRIFICSKNGALRIVKNGQLLERPFVKLTVPTVSEQGLLGVTFHPRFADSPYVYVYYTALVPEHNRISRFLARSDTVEEDEQIIFDMDTITAKNLMGGAIHFGRDGKLYVSSGNSAVAANSMSLGTTLGKILRLNLDGTIPSDNPFASKATGNARAIWALGIRNTFTFAVDHVTGRIFGCEPGDVSEEVNELQRGSNYGYDQQEGYALPRDPAQIIGAFHPAIYSYNGGCVIAAAFYPPPGVSIPGFPVTNARNFPPEYHRKFFFADHNNGWIKALDIDNPKSVSDFASGTLNPVDIKFAPDGSMYYLSRGKLGGSLMKVVYDGGALALSPSARPGTGLSLSAPPSGAWKMTIINGSIPDLLPGDRRLEIRDLHGSPRAPSATASTLPDGIYFIRSR